MKEEVSMWMPTEQISRYRSREPLVGKIAQNFHAKKDRQRVHGVEAKSENRRENADRDFCRFEGEELDCYV
jgi:hypothetical protein